MPRKLTIGPAVFFAGERYDSHDAPAWDRDLEDKLFALRRLEKVPFHYIVPDPTLLEPESIRFFHLDRRWIDRLVDGAVSAALVGSSDHEEASEMARIARRALDEREKVARNRYEFEGAAWKGQSTSPRSRRRLPEVTGMLVRSVVVRRWPKTEIRGYSRGGQTDRADWTLVDKVRHERLSDSIVLVLWAGCPDFVEMEEPKDGVQYGVDVEGGTVTVQLRNPDGSFRTPSDEIPVRFRKGGRRVLSLKEIRSSLQSEGASASNAGLGLQLQQTPFIQEFEGEGDPSFGFMVLLPGLQVLNMEYAALLATVLGGDNE